MHSTSTLTRSAPISLKSRGILGWLVSFQAAWRERKHLSELDAAARHDIGLSEADIVRELSRPMWNAPHHWMR